MKNNRLKDIDLFSAVIHEIRNSLNPVINLSSVLRRNTSERLTPDENSYLEIIERNGKKILNIIEEISYFNKLPEQFVQHSDSRVVVREAIENAFISMTGPVSDSGYKLICDVDENSSVIFTDYELFRRILENICMFFISSDRGQRSACFRTSMSDSGFHLISSRKKSEFSDKEGREFNKQMFIEGGAGAGPVIWLQFASQYINFLNGSLYYSQDNDGDVILSLTVPMRKEPGEEEFNRNIDEKVTVHSSGKEFIMLIIDDDIDNIIPVKAIIENEFKGAGKLYHAENGSMGLDLLEKIKPDIILLDLTLPDISGFSLVRNIKNLFVKNDAPVIAFTALDIVEDKEKMLRAGFDDVIRKPFNIDMFIQTINRWINS